MIKLQESKNTTASSSNRYSLLGCLAIVLSICWLFMILVANAAEVTAAKSETVQLRNLLIELIEKEAELKLEYEKRNDLRLIEEIAKNQFGMIKKDEVRRFYIPFERESKVEFHSKKSCH